MPKLAKTLAAAFAVLLVTSCAAIPERAQETTIAAIYKDPKAFDGKLLRVRGVMDHCVSLSCRLCSSMAGQLPDRSSTKCLRPYFNELLGGTSLEPNFRFAEITVEGRYDRTCDSLEEINNDLAAKNKGPGPPDVVDCLDRASNFEIARVLDVHNRWPSTDGLFLSRPGDPLEDAPHEQTKAIVKAHDLLPVIKLGTRSLGHGYIILQRHQPPTSDLKYAILCTCISGDCLGRWPSKQEHLIDSVANPYQCIEVVEVGGQWFFPPPPAKL
jgi:hypothetical protein